MSGHKTYAKEFKDSAAREVVENSRSMTSVANELGVTAGTLRRWVRAYRQHLELVQMSRMRQVDWRHPQGFLAGFDVHARLQELEKENRQLREREVILSGTAAILVQHIFESGSQ